MEFCRAIFLQQRQRRRPHMHISSVYRANILKAKHVTLMCRLKNSQRKCVAHGQYMPYRWKSVRRSITKTSVSRLWDSFTWGIVQTFHIYLTRFCFAAELHKLLGRRFLSPANIFPESNSCIIHTNNGHVFIPFSSGYLEWK